MADIVERLRWSISADTPARYPDIITDAIAEIERLRAALSEENLTKVYTMARGHWGEAATNENMASLISEEAYVGRWMSKYL